jgi:hypothetical protein
MRAPTCKCPELLAQKDGYSHCATLWDFMHHGISQDTGHSRGYPKWAPRPVMLGKELKAQPHLFTIASVFIMIRVGLDLPGQNNSRVCFTGELLPELCWRGTGRRDGSGSSRCRLGQGRLDRGRWRSNLGSYHRRTSQQTCPTATSVYDNMPWTCCSTCPRTPD